MNKEDREHWIDNYIQWIAMDIWYKAIDNPDDVYSYWKLFRQMLDTEFIWDHSHWGDLYMDENRAQDGLALRMKYCNEGVDIPNELDDISVLNNCLAVGRNCSVLEMIVAFAKRMDDEVMYNREYGDRSGIWCYKMFNNLGLLKYDDDHYNKASVTRVLNRFMNRKYDANGKGGLFYIPASKEKLQGYFEWIPNFELDMPNTELWQQMGIWTQLYDAGIVH